MGRASALREREYDPAAGRSASRFGVPAALFHACRITGRERQTVIANSCVHALRWANSKNWSLD